jgi:RNA polymerase sigma factor (sigma-70 family)
MTTATAERLTLEEEQELGRRIQAGDDSAVNALVEGNLRFAMYMANRYRREGIDIDDLIQEATIGMILAAQHYDPDRQVRFTSYAGWWIEAQLRRFLSRHSSVLRIGEGTQQVARRLKRVEERLLQENETVTRKMVAEEAGVDLATADFALGSTMSAPLSLNRTMGDVEGEFTMMDTVADETTQDAFDFAEVNAILSPLLESLGSRQRQIIRMRFSERRTCTDIGGELGLSGSRVQQIEIQAIRALRRHLMFQRRPLSELAAA